MIKYKCTTMSKVTAKYYLNTKLKSKVSETDGQVRYPIYIRVIHKRIMSSLKSDLGYSNETELNNIINSKKAQLELENIKSVFSFLEKKIIDFNLRETQVNLGKWIEFFNSPLYEHLEGNLFCSIDEKEALKTDLLKVVKERFLEDIEFGNIDEEDLKTFINIDFKNTEPNKISSLYNYTKSIFGISALRKLQYISTLRQQFYSYSILQFLEDKKFLPNFYDSFYLSHEEMEDLVEETKELIESKIGIINKMGELFYIITEEK